MTRPGARTHRRGPSRAGTIARMPSSSLAAAAARGALAGAAGTLAMDLVWYARHRRGGGEAPFAEWEITRSVPSWDEAPAPARMGRKIIEAVTGRPVPLERAAALSNVMHWGYGTSWAVGLGVLAARAGGTGRSWWHGPAFGSAVWASGYVVLPLAGVYEPIWRYDAATLGKDLSAHLVFGTVTDGVLRAV